MSKCAACVILLSALSAGSAWAAPKNKAIFLGGTLGSLPEKTVGLVDATDPTNMVFKAEKGGGTILIPWQSVQEIEYGQHVSRRWKSALLLTPWAIFFKGRKHIVTVTYQDAAGADQAAVFDFGKDEYRTALAALKAKSGHKIICQDQEAQKHFGGCVVMADEPEGRP